MSYRRITFHERMQIFQMYHVENLNSSIIAEQLNRNPSSISREAWKLIKPKLELRWSPNQIAQWLKMDYPSHSMSGKTIYNYIHLHMRGELKKIAFKDLRQHLQLANNLKIRLCSLT